MWVVVARAFHPVRAILVSAVALLCLALPADAERTQEDDIVASFTAGLHPVALLRIEPVPVAVRVSGDFWSADGNLTQLPQLRSITVAINRQGRLFDLACRPAKWDKFSPRANAKPAGSVAVRSSAAATPPPGRIPDQLPFLVRAKLRLTRMTNPYAPLTCRQS